MKKILAVLLLILPTLGFSNEHTRFYVEAFGGYTDIASPDLEDGPPNVGAFYSGSTYSRDLDIDHLAGIKVGWLRSDQWRFDLSYSNINGEMDWMVDFYGGSGQFDSDFESNVLLVNAYFSPKRFGRFKPYGGFGIGVAKNKLTSIIEHGYPSGTTADIQSGKKTEIAYRLALGTDYSLTDAWVLSFDLSMLNIGDFSTGNSRDVLYDGKWAQNNQSIGESEFENTSIKSANLGIRFLF